MQPARSISLFVVICLALSPKIKAAAQLAPPPSGSSTLLITAKSKSVSFADITASEIAIQEDGRSVTIQQVRHLSGAKMRYCILFDTSNSETKRFRSQQRAAIELLKGVVQPGDRGWLTLFNTASQEGEETDDPAILAREIAASRPGGGTSLYDAVKLCAVRMSQSPPETILRTIFVFSDGDDNQSHIRPKEAIEAAIRAGVRIYAISPGEILQAELSLKKLAGDTGGEALFSADVDVKDASKFATELSKVIRDPIEVTYVDDRKPGGPPRRIEVRCGRKHVALLTQRWLY